VSVFAAVQIRFDGGVMAKKSAAKKTGWDTLPKKYREYDPFQDAPLVPKRLLVKHGLWDEVVEDIIDLGDESTIRACFAEYGCKKAEVDGYLEQ
jgi:hypothetical protein